MTTEEKFRNFTPPLVRLMARDGAYGKPLQTSTIALRGNLHWALVDSYTWRNDWSTIPVDDALGFLRGCGLAIDNAAAWRRAVDYLSKKPTFAYLRRSPNWESIYDPLLKAWVVNHIDTPTAGLIPPVIKLIQRLAPICAVP